MVEKKEIEKLKIKEGWGMLKGRRSKVWRELMKDWRMEGDE